MKRDLRIAFIFLNIILLVEGLAAEVEVLDDSAQLIAEVEEFERRGDIFLQRCVDERGQLMSVVTDDGPAGFSCSIEADFLREEFSRFDGHLNQLGAVEGAGLSCSEDEEGIPRDGLILALLGVEAASQVPCGGRDIPEEGSCHEANMCNGLRSVKTIGDSFPNMISRRITGALESYAESKEYSESCLDGDQGDCLSEIISGLIMSISSIGEVVSAAARYTWDSVSGFFRSAFTREYWSSKRDAMMNISLSPTEQLEKLFNFDLLGWLSDSLTNIQNGIDQWIRSDVLCQQWDGTPHFSNCIEPLESYDCMDCHTRNQGVCLAVGVIGFEGLLLVATAGTVSAVSASVRAARAVQMAGRIQTSTPILAGAASAAARSSSMMLARVNALQSRLLSSAVSGPRADALKRSLYSGQGGSTQNSGLLSRNSSGGSGDQRLSFETNNQNSSGGRSDQDNRGSSDQSDTQERDGEQSGRTVASVGNPQDTLTLTGTAPGATSGARATDKVLGIGAAAGAVTAVSAPLSTGGAPISTAKESGPMAIASVPSDPLENPSRSNILRSDSANRPELSYAINPSPVSTDSDLGFALGVEIEPTPSLFTMTGAENSSNENEGQDLQVITREERSLELTEVVVPPQGNAGVGLTEIQSSVVDPDVNEVLGIQGDLTSDSFAQAGATLRGIYSDENRDHVVSEFQRANPGVSYDEALSYFTERRREIEQAIERTSKSRGFSTDFSQRISSLQDESKALEGEINRLRERRLSGGENNILPSGTRTAASIPPQNRSPVAFSGSMFDDHLQSSLGTASAEPTSEELFEHERNRHIASGEEENFAESTLQPNHRPTPGRVRSGAGTGVARAATGGTGRAPASIAPPASAVVEGGIGRSEGQEEGLAGQGRRPSSLQTSPVSDGPTLPLEIRDNSLFRFDLRNMVANGEEQSEQYERLVDMYARTPRLVGREIITRGEGRDVHRFEFRNGEVYYFLVEPGKVTLILEERAHQIQDELRASR